MVNCELLGLDKHDQFKSEFTNSDYTDLEDKKKRKIAKIKIRKHHIEQQLFQLGIHKGLKDPFLFIQNAFPCPEFCDGFFRDTSRAGRSFIFIVTGNQGGYGIDEALDYYNGAGKFDQDDIEDNISTDDYPYVLYYVGGFVTLISDPSNLLATYPIITTYSNIDGVAGATSTS